MDVVLGTHGMVVLAALPPSHISMPGNHDTSGPRLGQGQARPQNMCLNEDHRLNFEQLNFFNDPT